MILAVGCSVHVRLFSIASYLVGVYVTGWLKTGPKGVILNTMSDAFAVASLILKDLESIQSSKSGLSLKIPKRITTYEDYVKILEYERVHGKVTTVEKMMEIINGS